MKHGSDSTLENHLNKKSKKETHPAAIAMESPTKDMVLASQDLIPEIVKYLKLNGLWNMLQASKGMFKAIAQNENIWTFRLKTEKVPAHWEPNASSIERCKSFYKECDHIEETYPKDMIKALVDVKNIAALPLLETDKIFGSGTGYLHFSGVGRGVSQCGRHYIGLAAKIHDSQELASITLFERITENVYKNSIHLPPSYDYIMREETYDYLNRLCKHEPCGIVKNSIENEKVDSEGNSIVELMDAEEYEKVKLKK